MILSYALAWDTENWLKAVCDSVRPVVSGLHVKHLGSGHLLGWSPSVVEVCFPRLFILSGEWSSSVYTSGHSESKVSIFFQMYLRGILPALTWKALRGEFLKGHGLVGSLSLNAPIVGPTLIFYYWARLLLVWGWELLISLLFKFSVNS